MVVTVTGVDSRPRQFAFPGARRVTVGRSARCDVPLSSAFVSDLHLVFDVSDDGSIVVECVGENPTLINGAEHRSGCVPIASGDAIFVQGFLLQIGFDVTSTPVDDSGQRRAFNAVLKTLHEAVIRRVDPRQLTVDDIRSPSGRRAVVDVLAAELQQLRLGDDAIEYGSREALRDSLRRMLIGGGEDAGGAESFGSPAQQVARKRYAQNLAAALRLTGDGPARAALGTIRHSFDAAFEGTIGAMPRDVAEYLTRWLLHKEVCDLMFAFGPLTDLLRLPDISEVMVVSKDLIYIEVGGIVHETGKTFLDDAVSERVIERILAPVNRRVDRSSPMVDARLPDGSRVNAVVPPVAQRGPCITIRRFSSQPLTIDTLIAKGALDVRAAELLKSCVRCRKNIMISGGTGSGKTTMLNALSAWIPDGERIVTIEDIAELRLQQRHVVSLEGRPMNVEQQGQITIRDLVRNALRMRPDRIVVGECRGPEALDMLQAMNTGHDGSLTTAHANSPAEMVSRLEVMVLQASDMPMAAIRQQIAAAVDIIVQIGRTANGSRQVSHISEVCGYSVSDAAVRIVDVMRRSRNGELAFTGYLPSFVAELAADSMLDLEAMIG